MITRKRPGHFWQICGTLGFMIDEPFSSGSDSPPVLFAGRDEIYAYLKQYLLNPVDAHAVVFSGREGSGKTMLLRHFSDVFEQTMPAIYVSFTDLIITDEKNLLVYLINRTNRILDEYGFTPRRLPVIPVSPYSDVDLSPDEELTVLRQWLKEDYLSELVYIIRPQRRLVWLLDDADVLLKLLDDDRLASDTLAYLYDLSTTYPQFSIVMTISLDNEHRLNNLMPLVNPAEVQRLGSLSRTTVTSLVREVVPVLTDRAIKTIYDATGGNPRLVQQFMAALQQQPLANLSSSDILNHVIPAIYESSFPAFRKMWLQLNRDERLVLTAVSELIYHDSPRPVNVPDIEAWLLKNDYPLSNIAILASIRSLEYQEILASREEGLYLVTGMMQQWLVENARLDDAPSGLRNVMSWTLFSLPLWWFMLAIAGAIIVIVFLLSIATGGTGV